MATTTPNYLWSVPTSSDLVKNGATAIETLGDSVDASLWNSGYGQAGKNKIINGDFLINQRNLTSNSADGYGFDRWIWAQSGSTGTYSAQTFTLGAAPVAGYEGTNFARVAITTGNDFSRLIQRIESVRTFANQTVTLSFWAKGTNPTTAGKLNVRLQQNFGSGGSTAVATAEQDLTLTASWVRYSYVFSVASIAGKTIGVDNYLAVDIGQLANASTDSWTLDVWGVQVEYGSYATPFQTATGTIQGELAACQRYYFRVTGGELYSTYGFSKAYSTTVGRAIIQFPTQMRQIPSSVEYSTLTIADWGVGNYPVTALTLVTNERSVTSSDVEFTVASGLTAQRMYNVSNNNNTAGYIGFSAEL